MKKFFTSLVFTLFCSIFIYAQTPTPTPSDDDVVKISTDLIQLDVTVTDKKGNVVKDLKREDFEIFENGKLQDISNFSFISNQQTKTQNSTDKTNVPKPVGELRAEQIRRTIALVVDDLSLSFESAFRVRRALKKFVDEQMQEGDLVAIIRTGAGIGALQQFTSDKRILYAAIERVKFNPLGRGNISAFAPIEPTPLELQAMAGDDGITEEQISEEKERLQRESNTRSDRFTSGTLGALQYIVGGMKNLTGRKSVILFSDGFEMFSRTQNDTREASIILDFLRRLIDTANRASVVFYTVDARGLVTTNLNAQDVLADNSGESLQTKISERSAELFDTQQGLVHLATQTGGFPILNNNDLNNATAKILEDQSYYLIGYQPDTDTFDATKRRFNKLDIKVKREGVNVRYRSGFFNVNDDQIAKTDATIKKTPAQQITDALVSPFAKNEINVRLNTLFGNNANGSFVRSLLHVNAQDLKFTDEADGKKKASFDVLAASFGDNGQIIDQIAKTYTMTVNADGYKQVMRDGFVYYFTLPIKKAGAYQLRIAIRDAQSEKLGSASQFIEVPNIKKDKLNISGIVLENLTRQQWEVANSNTTPTIDLTTNPMSDTSLRKFKRGTILRYAYEIYNPKLDAAKKPNLTIQIRIFQDGKLVLEGNKKPIEVLEQTDLERIKSIGALSLGGEMPTGDYILQIIITDNLAKQKSQTTSQFVQFELVE